MPHSTYARDRQSLANAETSCRQLVSRFLERIDDGNGDLNAFLFVDRENALGRADELDAELAQGNMRPLHGLVLAVKDVICQKDRQVTCGSKMLDNFESLYTATALERLEQAGAIIIGRTNCDEFGMGSTNETSYFGAVRNPHDRDRVAGGSSGGSAAAVAAGMCHAALGSDTGGSIRQPSAFCGVAGLKPTYGRVSRFGLVAYASSFDVIGPVARSAEDLALIMNVMAGADMNDGTSVAVDVPDYVAALEGDVRGLRVGIPKEFVSNGGLIPEVADALAMARKSLEDAGATVSEVSLPHTKYGVATYYVLTTAEASSNLARFDGVRFGYRAGAKSLKKEAGGTLIDALYTRSRSEGFGEEVKRRIMLGTYSLSAGYYDAYYARAQRVRTLIRRDFDQVFSEVDILLTPATPTLPFKLGEQTHDPLEMYLNDVFTVPASLAGIPAMTVPMSRSDGGLPVGVQLMADHFQEARLLQTGDSLMKMAEPA